MLRSWTTRSSASALAASSASFMPTTTSRAGGVRKCEIHDEQMSSTSPVNSSSS